jgi:beta-glucosidase
VLFPFGYGLSYTMFSYSNPKVSATTFRDADGISVSVDITNTGNVAGKEVVQVYVHDHKSCLARPPKELKGFAKVDLLPGETKSVTIPLDFRAFAFYHPAYKQWITEAGEFDILVGPSSADIRSAHTVSLQSTLELPSLLNRGSTMGEWLEDPSGSQVLGPILQQIKAGLQANFGGAEGADIGFDPMDFLKDMPLTDLFNFLGSALPMSPEAIVDGLLGQVHKPG